MRGIITLVILVALIGVGGAYGLYQSVKNPKPTEIELGKLPKTQALAWVTIRGGQMQVDKLVTDLEDTPSPALRRVLIPYAKEATPAQVVIEISDQKRLDKLSDLLILKKADQKVDYAAVADIIGLKDNVITGMLDPAPLQYDNTESSAIGKLVKAKTLAETAVAIRAGAKPPGVLFSSFVILVAVGLLVGGLIFLKRTEGNAEATDEALAGLTTDPSTAETKTALTEPKSEDTAN